MTILMNNYAYVKNKVNDARYSKRCI